MAKVTRVFQNQFMINGSASHSGQFGSKAAGAPVNTLDPNTIQALPAFTNNGWIDAIVGANKQPFNEDMNGLFRLIFYQFCSIFQDGIPSWNAGTIYFTGSIVRKDGTSELYGSLTDNNTGNALPNQTSNGNWNFLNPQTVAVGTITPVGNGVTFGNLLCDGTAYATAAFPNLSAYLAGTWDTFNGASSPGGGMFRVPDLRSLTLMGAGQGTGFSVRTLAQLVGQETHTLTVSEIPGNLTVVDNGHFHQILGGATGTGNVGINTPPGPQVIPGSSNFSAPGYFTNSPGGGQQLIKTATTGITVGGGGGSHNLMQPTAGVNWVIKT